MKLGYNRAGRLVDQLEDAGIIGPFEGSVYGSTGTLVKGDSVSIEVTIESPGVMINSGSEFIADLKGVPIEVLANQTSSNFYDCFQIDRA